jgi:hypothetical protein
MYNILKVKFNSKNDRTFLYDHLYIIMYLFILFIIILIIIT